MSSLDVSGFTRRSILFAFGINFLLLAVLGYGYPHFLRSVLGIEQVVPLIVSNFSNRINEMGEEALMPSDVVVWASLIGSAGLLVMWVSSRLDFIDKEDDKFNFVLFPLGIYAGLAWVGFLLESWFIGCAQVANHDFFAAIGVMLLVIPTAILGLFTGSYVFVCVTIFIAGLICLSRAVVFLKTSHRMRGVWGDWLRAGRFNPRNIINSFGQPSESPVHARALRKDLATLLHDVKQKRDEVAGIITGLTKGIHDDVARMKDEARLSVLLAEIEEMKVEAEVLKTYRKGGRP